MTRAKVSEVWDAVVDAGALNPEWIGLPGTDARTHAQVLERLRSADLDDWASAAARVGFCSSPVRLVGSSLTVDRTTGEVVRTYASAEEIGGVTFVRCGNRRADRCPSCGANVKAVQRMLGHASAAMTLDIYAGLFGDDLDGVADALDDLVP